MKLLIKNADVVNPRGKSGKLDILINGDKIEKLAPSITDADAQIIDACGLCAAPGFVDIHCHLREPGYEYKEDIASGTLAAAHGGFTSVCCMPNTDPVIDTETIIEEIKARAARFGYAKVYPIAAITKDLKGEELTEMGCLKGAGAIAFSDDGRPVSSALMMRRALQYASGFDALIVSHSEELSLVEGSMNEGYTASLLGLKGIPRAAEEIMIAREIILAEGLNTRVHIAHVSTRGSLELIRQAKARGVKVTCETCPHYFSATDELVGDYDTNAKVNPPLRTADDVAAIIEGLKDGTIDCIATDHAPHHIDEKRCEFQLAANGLIGFETAFSLGVTHLVKPGHITLEKLVELMSARGADIMRLDAGVLKEGGAADVTLFNADLNYTFEAADIYSKSKNTPFIGQKLTGRVIYTLTDGKLIIKDAKKVV
jgi:dihydroorotase